MRANVICTSATTPISLITWASLTYNFSTTTLVGTQVIDSGQTAVRVRSNLTLDYAKTTLMCASIVDASATAS